MRKVPGINYEKLISDLRIDGWVIVRQRGSHICIHKSTKEGKIIKIVLVLSLINLWRLI